jgi:hypothetical protein
MRCELIRPNRSVARIFAGALAVVALRGGAAFACGACAYDMMASRYPATFEWAWTAVAWFWAQAFIVSWHRPRAMFPGLVGALFASLLAVYLVATMGPAPAIPLFLWTLVCWPALHFAKGRDEERPYAHRLPLHVVGALAIIAFLAFGIYQQRRWSALAMGEKLVERGFTHFATAELQAMKRQAIPPLDDYRTIVRGGEPMWPSFELAAGQLGEHGDPAIDIPLLEAALERNQGAIGLDSISRSIDQLKARQSEAKSE